MARVYGPLMSMDASGTVAKALTFAKWKGQNYCRQWFIPANPQSATQVNVRTAMTLLVALWQTLSGAQQGDWNTLAKGTGKSGFNVFVSRGMDEYVIQLTTAVTPTSVSYTGTPPAEVWTWA